jgi:hypothetical protein
MTSRKTKRKHAVALGKAHTTNSSLAKGTKLNLIKPLDPLTILQEIQGQKVHV